MQDLLSYQLSDLMLFSRGSYLRVFERYNEIIFPAQFGAFLLGLAGPWLIMRRRDRNRSGLLIGLALLQLAVAYAFVWRYYAEINWLVQYLLPLLLLQALVFVLLALRKPARNLAPIRPARHIAAGLLWGIALVAYPVIETLQGRSPGQLSAFVLTPDPLAIISISMVWLLSLHWLAVLPALLWLLFSTLTLMAMNSVEFILPLAAVLLWLLFMLIPARLTQV